MKKLIACILIALTFFVGIQHFTPAPPPKPIAVTETTLNYEINVKKIIAEINAVRGKYNVSPVKRHKLLMKSAQMKADDLIKNDYFDHNGPNGQTPWIFFDKAGYDYQYAGENLAINFLDAEEREKTIVEAWLLSPKHKEIMLISVYEDVGIGYKNNVVVCHFGVE